MGDPEKGPGGPPPPLLLDQTEARGAGKIFFETGAPPPFSQGVDDRPPPPYLKVWIRHWLYILIMFIQKHIRVFS